MTSKNSGDGWSRYLRRMTSRPGWSVARLARESGIHRSTIFGWIKDGSEGLTVASIRAIATALDDTVEHAVRAAVADDERDYDDEARKIMSSDAPEHIKIELLDYLARRKAEDEQRRADEIEMLVRQVERAERID